jgi:hypothetical protein
MFHQIAVPNGVGRGRGVGVAVAQHGAAADPHSASLHAGG